MKTKFMRSILVVFFLFIYSGFIAQDQKLSKKNPTNITSKAAVLYANDFLSPSQWSFSNTSLPNTNWQITTNLNSAPFAAFRPAGFLSAYNGFAIIDSDAQGSTAHQNAVLSLIPRISICENEPFVLLRFSQMYRKFNDTTSVEISNDGNTWTEFVVNQNMVNSTNTANPATVTVNISAIAGNQDSVYIRFRYRAKNAWFWAIDDVKILKQDQFDLQAEKLIHGTMGNWGSKIAYSKLPSGQIQPIQISGQVRNAGFSGQGDAQLIAASLGFSSQSLPDIAPPNLVAIYDINQSWTPTNIQGNQALGVHVISSEIDAVPTDNFYDSLKIEITDNFYARDKLIREGRVSNNVFSIGFEVGNVFDIFSDQILSSANVLVLSETTANSTLFAKIYEAIDSNTFLYLSGSDTIVVPANTQDTWYRVRMRNLELLEAGKSYLLVAGSTGSQFFPGLVIGTSGLSEPFTTFQLFNSSSEWFSFTEIPMVRMGFESVVSTDKLFNEKLNLSVFPNPASGFAYLNFEASDEVQIFVRDINGKIIFSTIQENPTGKQPFELNTSNYNKGIYFVQLNTKGFFANAKLIIE